jgi:hypothetical protein
VTSCRPAENSIFVLKAHDVDVVDIQKVGGPAIGVKILLRQFKSNAGWICIPGLNIVDGQSNALGLAVFSCDRFAQIGGKGRYAALPRQVVADECNATDCGGGIGQVVIRSGKVFALPIEFTNLAWTA